ncbi:hypothetical protein ACN47E_000441 [Coniothyrium glycines]
MSAPSSEGRLSNGTDPSVSSSHTLFSQNSGAYQPNGEGSSSPRYSAASRQNHIGAFGAESTGQRGLPSVEAGYEPALARRAQRVRRSGGFLLDPNLPSSPSRRHGSASNPGQQGKRASRHDRDEANPERKKMRSKNQLSPGSSPLAHETQVDGQRVTSSMSHIDHGVAHAQDNDRIRVGKMRNDVREAMSYDRSPSPNTALQPRAIDPNQLVHMALNLSESRRRNFSSGQMLSSHPRVASSTQREGSLSNHGAGSSLRQYLNEQRRTSRNISPMGVKSSASRHMSTSAPRSSSIAFNGLHSVNASPATMARVEKARRYIELRMEYLRLLECLPPLKPDATSPGNFVVSSANVPGSPQAHLTRVPSYAGKQHDLGRPYNPLQFIRNRRLRVRERRVLDHPPEEFLDVEQVQDWVDRVEQRSRHQGYRRDDAVQLPRYHADHPVASPPSKSSRPHKGWVFSSEDLLADAYWLEQDANKTLVENRHGHRIFMPREIEKRDLLDPRASKEYPDKRRRSWVDNIAIDPGTDNESEKGSERGRRLLLLPTLRTDSPRTGRHSRRGSRLRNKADTDTSDSDAGSRRRKPRLGADVEHNTGPLALLLDQQAKASQAETPSIISPDTPDKWGRKRNDFSEHKVSRDSLEVPRLDNGFTYVEEHGPSKVPPRSRVNLSLALDDIEPRSSIEDWDSTAPNTPLQPKRFPHIGSDFSPPPSRAGSDTKKSKRSKFNPFHLQEPSSEQRSDVRQEPSVAEKKRVPRQTSEEMRDEKHIGSSILAAPGAVRNLLAHRKNDSTSSLPSPDKLQRRDTQEPHSAVTRFLKGVKHEGTKVGEFIFRRDRADDSDADTMSDRNSVDLDTDVSLKNGRLQRPAISRTTTADTTRSTSGMKSERNHLELPSFRPVHETQYGDGDTSDLEHHISRQTRERKNSRSPRFNRLAPPRMDLGTISGNSSDNSIHRIRSHSQERINKVLAHPGANILGGLPVTALRKANDSDRRRSTSRPTLDGKRHWSIADDDDHVLRRKKNPNVVSQADIARVRALFLCSGIKAKELERRAHSIASPPPDFLIRAAHTAKVQLRPITRREEHVLAARILVKDLDSSAKSLRTSLETFRDNAIKDLTSRIDSLQSVVNSDLMPRILQGGESAVLITSEISGQGPLQVKEVTDEIDRMLRARKRRMRYLRGVGWMLVEWLLVAVMWWLWLVVVLVGSVKRVFGLGWGVLRWLFWL